MVPNDRIHDYRIFKNNNMIAESALLIYHRALIKSTGRKLFVKFDKYGWVVRKIFQVKKKVFNVFEKTYH